MDEIRAFVAVELSEELKRQLRGAQLQLKSAPGAAAVRWVSPDRMHLTLKFLGNILRARVADFSEALAQVVRGQVSFTLTAHGLGCFPNTRRPNVIWVGLEGAVDRLVELARLVDDALAAQGVAPETRPFSPHLTLGRVERDASPLDRARLGDVIQRLPQNDYGPVPVLAVHLIQSDLCPGGPVYTVLSTARLNE